MTTRRPGSLSCAAVVLSALAAACGGGGGGAGGGGATPASGSWFQTGLGSVNTYRLTQPDGTSFEQAMTITQSSAASVARKSLAAGSTIYQVATFSLANGAVAQVGQSAYYVADDTPVPASATSYVPPALLVPADTAAGRVATSTSTVTTPAGTYTVTRTLTAVGMEPVTVPAGTWTALRVSMQAAASSPLGGAPTASERWFVDGVGMVKTVSWPVATPASRTTTELLSTSAGGGGGGGGGGGAGAATTLASGLVNAAHLAVDATSVYWTESADGATANAGTTSVKKVPVGGGAVVTLAHLTGQPNYVGTTSIGLDAGAVYWTQSNAMAASLHKVGLAGGAVTTLATAPACVANVVALDASTAYFTDFDKVRAVPKSGGPPADLVAGLQEPWAIAVDATSVYWTSAWDGILRKAPKGGGAATAIASGASTAYFPRLIAVDATGVYFVGGGAAAGDVKRVGLGGGAVTTLAAGSGASSLALDATHVYWSGGGAIFRVAKGGGTPTSVAVTGSPAELALDAGNVYWVDGSSVRKLAKW